MIKNFVSKALLSVFMDKQARDKLKKGQTKKSDGVSREQNEADGKALAGQPADPMDSMNRDEIADLVRETLAEAERELDERKTKKAASPERQALIDNALSIHRSQRHLVDDLPPEQREKLMYMALQMLGPKNDRNEDNE